MIKGASFVASNCAYHLRNSLVVGLRDMGFRVDGLGQCLHTQNITEGISLDVDENEDGNEEDILRDYMTKKHVLSKYMFHLGNFCILLFVFYQSLESNIVLLLSIYLSSIISSVLILFV